MQQTDSSESERPKKRAVHHRTKPKKRPPTAAVICVFAILAIAIGCFIGSRSGVPKNALGLDNISPDLTQLDTSSPLYSYGSGSGMAAKVGIDVSVHQGTIDWAAVKASGVDFAVIRLGYRGYGTGKIVQDVNFAANIEGAQSAGLDLGVYFYSQALTEEEAEEEAAFVIDALSGINLTYPVVYDQEDYTEDEARTDGLTGEQATANCVAFCKAIRNAGYLPMIYMNNYWATTMYDMKKLRTDLIWYADYTQSPTLDGGFSIWQYTNRGSIDGIDGYVDVNLLFFPKGIK